jgi:hypothetical protein
MLAFGLADDRRWTNAGGWWFRDQMITSTIYKACVCNMPLRDVIAMIDVDLALLFLCSFVQNMALWFRSSAVQPAGFAATSALMIPVPV